MNPIIFIWNTLFFHPIVNLIIVIYKYLGGNLAISIIVLTVLIRLLLWPLMKSQIDAMKKMQSMKPKIDALKKQYKDDKKKFQEEQLRLYKETGTNPVGSCLPLLLQLPVIFAVYSVIKEISSSKTEGVFNNILYSKTLQLPATGKFNTNFFGINLAKDAATVGVHHFAAFVPYVIIALLVGITQFFASKVSLPTTVQEETEAVEIVEARQSKKKKKAQVAIPAESPKEKEEMLDPEQFSKTLSMQMLYIFPFILTWISLGFSGSIPSALSLYWIVQSVMLVTQTLILQDKLPWKKQNLK